MLSVKSRMMLDTIQCTLLVGALQTSACYNHSCLSSFSYNRIEVCVLFAFFILLDFLASSKQQCATQSKKVYCHTKETSLLILW